MNLSDLKSETVKKSTYPIDYQSIKKNSLLAEGHAYFYNWAESHSEGDAKSLIMYELRSFEDVVKESSLNSQLDAEHPFSKSLANALYHAAKDALSQNLPIQATQLFYALSHLLPTNYDIFLGLGLSFQAQGNFNDSVEAFKHAISLNPQAFPAYLYIAESYLNLKLLDKFDESITESKRLIPKDSKVFLQHIQYLVQ